MKVWDTSNWQVIFEPDFAENMVNERILSLALSADMNGVMTLDLATGKVISHQEKCLTIQQLVINIPLSMDVANGCSV